MDQDKFLFPDDSSSSTASDDHRLEDDDGVQVLTEGDDEASASLMMGKNEKRQLYAVPIITKPSVKKLY